ncbi:MAG: DNA internalization-related competence protein ComEC/Rec2 [Rugosibacter sp.]|jgi:competence protein ComEC
MRLFVLAFALGVWLVQQQAALPDGRTLLAIGLVAVLFSAILWLLKKSALARRREALNPSLESLFSGWRLSEKKAVFLTGFLRVIAGCVLGFVWASAVSQWRLADTLPGALEGQDIVVVGVVSALPEAMSRGVRFRFDVESARWLDKPAEPAGTANTQSIQIPGHISLAWYRGAPGGRDSEEAFGMTGLPVHAGERWRFTVRLKRPHGNVNPHGFDYEAWLFERNIRATGYVRPRTAERLDTVTIWQPAYAVERLRETIRAHMQAGLPDSPFAGILIALVIGDQQAIKPALWQQFAQTGITHLMSISGLHVTMLAGLFYGLVGWLWRRSSVLPLHFPAQKAAAVGGFVAALTYSLLAGFAVPAQRTMMMLGVVALSRLAHRELAASRILAWALLFVLMLDPLAVVSAGFWLSFGAVAVLFYISSGRQGRLQGIQSWGQAQWAVTLGMLPALLALFGQFSLVSPLANAVAIPLVSFVITPLAMLGAVLGALPIVHAGFNPLLWLAHAATQGLMLFIAWLAALPGATWQQAAPPAAWLLLALAGGVWLLLPKGFPARWLGYLAFLPLLTSSPPRPDAGQAVVNVLDVGQGLAIHVQTARHDLLFDAGPAYSKEADSGNRLIVPYLRSMGVRHLDEMVVSHADTDHSGGAASVLAAVPVGLLRSSLPQDHFLLAQAVPQQPCRAGDAWVWDGVRFEVLYPENVMRAVKSNAISCVMMIAAGGRRLLITADIEAAQEEELIARGKGPAAEKSAVAGRREYVFSSDSRLDGNGKHAAGTGREIGSNAPGPVVPSLLAADVLIVPHHGSLTSSTKAFIAAVHPQAAIFTVGYRNRFGHPKLDVVSRYIRQGTALHRTDQAGAVKVTLSAAGVAIDRARDSRRRYWQDNGAEE